MKKQISWLRIGKTYTGIAVLVTAAFTISAYKTPQKIKQAHYRRADTAATPAKGAEFRLAVIPDIQHYTGHLNKAKPEMWYAQVRWIKQHHVDSNIVYVAGLGDTVDDIKIDSVYDTDQQWKNATLYGGYYDLETPAPGIAYGVAVGNHDEADFNYSRDDKPGMHHNHPGISPVRNTTAKYNEYLGVAHFKNKPWYGGHANILGKDNNDCHWDKFTVAGQQYIVVYLPYDNEAAGFEDKDGLMIKWARSVIQAHKDAKAIVVSHSILKGPNVGTFSPQGQAIYDGVKDLPNVFMMLCGHVTGEYMRKDTYQGHTISTYLIDCQALPMGGGGRMRTMRINTVTDAVSINTFSPYR